MLWLFLRRRVQRPGWVPTVPEWKCQPWLSTSYLSESSWGYVEREFLFTSALFSRRILHQPGLQGWDRVQVCPQGPDLCCCGNRRLQKRKGWSWCIESGPKTLWWDHPRMADQGNIYARGNFPLETFCNSKIQEKSLFKSMYPTEIPLRLPCYTNISLFVLAIFTGTAGIKREVCLYSTFCIFVRYKSPKLTRSTNLTVTAVMTGGTQLVEGAYLPDTRFCRESSKSRVFGGWNHQIRPMNHFRIGRLV